MYDVARIHHEDLKDASGNSDEKKSMKHVGLDLPVLFCEKEKAKKYSLNDS
jgi:hypothetical protein